ncbi:MAG: hypothetical protein OXK81_02580 [Chloroflexota bacterium]|nr:hypothetical protein [Chloroflexota bacterium]
MYIIPFEMVDPIPFQFPEVYGGLADSEGLLSISSDVLTLEFQIKDGLIGAFKSRVKKVELPFDQIREVQLQSNMLGTNLTVVADSIQLVEDVPNAKQGEFKVKFPRSHRKEAATLAREASVRVSQNKIDRLDRVLDSE